QGRGTMTDIELAWNLSSPALLGLAAAAIALLLVLIIRARVHAFIALTIVSVATALASGVLPSDLIDVLFDGFGSTLASVALLVGLGAMLGRMLELSGGAEVLTDALIRAFGEKRAPLALGVTSLLFGFPIFFDAGLVVMLPIIFAMPAAMAFSAMHIFVPPHPGPVAASGLLGANVGLVLVCGLIIAIPAWYLTGYLFGLFIGKRIEVSVPDVLSGGKGDEFAEFASRPKLSQVVFLLVLPLVLIFANTGLSFAGEAGWVDPESIPVASLRLLGETPIALLITVVIAMWLLGWRQQKGRAMV